MSVNLNAESSCLSLFYNSENLARPSGYQRVYICTKKYCEIVECIEVVEEAGVPCTKYISFPLDHVLKGDLINNGSVNGVTVIMLERWQMFSWSFHV